MGFRYGLMGPNMKASGSMEKPTVKESSFILTETCTMGSGGTTKHKATEYICTIMGPNTTDTGMRTIRMVTE